jgi:uroporphyrinogen-III synthase
LHDFTEAGNTEGSRKQCRGRARVAQKIPMLLTRPEGSNASFAARIAPALAARIDPVRCPLIRIDPVQVDPLALPNTGAIALFTSSNGVRFAPPAGGNRALCVGETTRDAARDAGWEAEFAGQTAQEMIRFILREKPSAPLFHFSGRHVRGRIVETLQEAGLSAWRVVLYDQVLLPLSNAANAVLLWKTPVIVPLFSPRAAAHFAALAPCRAGVVLVALSPAVAEAAGKIASFETLTATEPTADALLASVEKCADTLRLA